MLRNYDFPLKKNLYSSLISVFGLGSFKVKYILKKLNLNYFKKNRFLNDIEKKNILKYISIFKICDDLKYEVKKNIKNLIDIKCYRGVRHLKNLPVRGQNTRNNSRTRKGHKKKVILKSNNYSFKKNVKKK